MATAQGAQIAQRTTSIGLGEAVHRNAPLSREGMLERLFTLAFRGLVYPQIWEDPVVDMDALALGPNDRMVTIASGGCNALSYLVGNPAGITAVDLNGAHIALTRLKVAAARTLPDYDAFWRFFGEANRPENIADYDRLVRPALDEFSRSYWDTRTLGGGRRIDAFASGFYRRGLLGRFIGAAHLLSRLHGVNPAIILSARNREEQRDAFERHFAPLFERPHIRFLLKQPASLYGLGIPPAQYRALAGDDEQGIGAVVRERLRKLCCDFDIRDNYFAWQAFGRAYDAAGDRSVPPYLARENYEALRGRVDRLSTQQVSYTAFLRDQPAGSLDAYVLLDAQDWMNDADLTALWSEITRTARTGARVIFRTAADERLLPGRIPTSVLNAWRYDEARSRALGQRDRSSIYGAFHLYTLAEAA